MSPRRSVRPLSLVALGFALAVSAAGLPPTRPPALQVEAPPELARQASAVRALETGEWKSLFDLVGVQPPGPPIRVVLAAKGSPLTVNVATWVSGYAVPEMSTVVLFPDRVPSYPDRTLEALLHHEVAHVLVARAAAGGVVPRWFGEGTAPVAAREWGIEDGARVALATIGRGPRSLADVDAGFSGDTATASRSYAVSAALVRYLLRSEGEAAVARILAGVARGSPFDAAFAAVAGEGVGAFGRRYFRHETVWTTWVPFVTSSTVLWMAITALALLAIKRRRERDAELRERWALEEGPPLPAASPRRPEDDPGGWN